MVDYQKIFRASPGQYLLLNRDFAIVDVSDAYLEATMTDRSILGAFIFDVFPDNPNDDLSNGVRNLTSSLSIVLKTGKPHQMQIQKYDIRRPDGTFEIRYWSPTNIPVHDDSGEVEFILHTVKDVTRDVFNEEVLQSKEILFQSCIESLKNTLMFSVDSNYEYLIFNSSHKRITRQVYGIDLKPGMNLLDGIPNASDKARAKHNLDKALSGQWHSTIEEFGEIERFFFETQYNPVYDVNGDVIGVTVLSMNVTDRVNHQAEMAAINNKLEDANKELEAFSYSVSHDLKAPLRSLEGFSKALMEKYGDQFDETGERWLSFISDNASRMGLLIDDILHFSRVNRTELKFSLINMTKIARETFDELISDYGGRKVLFDIGNLPTIKGDVAMLRLVWQNLISNALKYTAPCDVAKIHINGKQQQGFVVYSIIDNGVGFDNKYKDKLFNVFQRLHSNADFDGTGVGLAIVSRIIKKHKGWIKASAKLNDGAKFTFALPIIN